MISPKSTFALALLLLVSSCQVLYIPDVGNERQEDKDEEEQPFMDEKWTLSLENGNVSMDGLVYDSDTTVVTSVIPNNFFISVNEGYVVYAGYLYNGEGQLVSTKILQPYIYNSAIDDFAYSSAGEWNQRSFFSTNSLPSGYGIRLVIKKTEGGDIDSKDEIVNTFSPFDGEKLRGIVNRSPEYRTAANRLEQVKRLVWTPQKKVAAAKENDFNSHYYLAGETVVGIPYSSVKEYTKYIPNDVSIRTFLTSLNNPHSLFYTEDILGARSRSEYGVKYHGSNCSSYYGGVCSSLVSYVLGFPYHFISSDFVNGRVPGLTEIIGPNANNIRPFDVIWYSGHVSVVGEMFLDEDDTLRYICWDEEARPVFRSTPYTPELFDERLRINKCRVFRLESMDDIPELDNSNFEYNDRICTFAGDYAAFVSGDDIYINAVLGPGAERMVLFREGDAEKITISLDSYIGSDMADIKLQDGLMAGNYSAWLANADGVRQSGKTHFQIVDVLLAVDHSGETIRFSVEGGLPFELMLEEVSGGRINRHSITSQEIVEGQARLHWNAKGRYVKLVARAEYGSVCKRVKVD